MTFLAAILSFLFVFAPAAVAEDFTGKWSGSFTVAAPDGTPRDEKIFLDLKHKGADLAGSAGPTAEMQWPVTKGLVDGTKLTFQVQIPEGPLMQFTLMFAEGHLKGDAAAEFQGEKLSAKVDAQRVTGGLTP